MGRPMSDSKKPKLSEIEAHEQHAIREWNRTRAVIPTPLGHVPYLLDLVKRLGKALQTLEDVNTGCKHCSPVLEARALILEIKE